MRSAGGIRTDIRDGLSVLRSAAFDLNGGVALKLADERRVRLERLGDGDAANLDIKALTGRSPWLEDARRGLARHLPACRSRARLVRRPHRQPTRTRRHRQAALALESERPSRRMV